jgi:hypothetical protein
VRGFPAPGQVIAEQYRGARRSRERGAELNLIVAYALRMAKPRPRWSPGSRTAGQIIAGLVTETLRVEFA